MSEGTRDTASEREPDREARSTAEADASVIDGARSLGSAPQVAGAVGAGTPPSLRPTIARRALALQRTHGNAYVQRLMRRSSSLASATRPPATQTGLDLTGTLAPPARSQEAPSNIAPQIHVVQRNGEEDEGITGEYFNLSGVEVARASMNLRFELMSRYSTGGMRAADRAKSKLVEVSSRYGRAYRRYANVIRVAGEDARAEEFWIGICVGIATGLLVGAAFAFVLPATAGAALVLTASEAALGQAVVGAGVGAAASETLSRPAADIEPTGLSPDVLSTRVWQTVADLYRASASMGPAAVGAHRYAMAAEYLAGQIRLRVAGGEPDMPDDDMFDLMDTLVRADNQMRRHDAAIASRLAQLERLNSAINSISPRSYSLRRMEQDIWILWISELDDPSVLDADAIEDHLASIGVLGSGGRLGVDFGWWTSSDDEKDARRAARREARTVRDRLAELEGGGL